MVQVTMSCTSPPTQTTTCPINNINMLDNMTKGTMLQIIGMTFPTTIDVEAAVCHEVGKGRESMYTMFFFSCLCCCRYNNCSSMDRTMWLSPMATGLRGSSVCAGRINGKNDSIAGAAIRGEKGRSKSSDSGSPSVGRTLNED